MAELPPPPEGIVLAHFIVSDDVERSRRFYTEVLGGRIALRPREADLCRTSQQLDYHQCRRRPDRRQASGHPGDAARSQPGQQLPQYPGQRHPRRVCGVERPGCSVPDAAETAPVRDPLLHPRSRRSSDRSGANHGPRGGLDARSLAAKYARRRFGVNAEVTGNAPRVDGSQSPGH